MNNKELIEQINGNGKANGNGNGHIKELLNGFNIHSDEHVGTSVETPLRKDAFQISDTEKISAIEEHFRSIMEIMGLDLTDDSLRGTPHRVAKMYIKEIFYGLNPANKPVVSLFENKFRYNEMLVEKDIRVNSFCEHHFLPVQGKAHVAYLSSGEVIGLSKINRIVDYYARRPQVQERMTKQIADELKRVLNTDDVAVLVYARHFCVSCRGVNDDSSSTVTSAYSGRFRERETRKEFLEYVGL